MNMKNIRFDLEYVENTQRIQEIMLELQCNIEDAIKIDYEKNYKWQSRDITRETSYIMDYLLMNYNIATNKNIVINFLGNENIEEIIVKEYKGNYEIKVPFRYDSYIKMTTYKKRLSIVEILIKSFNKIKLINNENRYRFNTIIKELQKSNFINVFYCGKAIENKNLDLAQIYCEQSIDKISIFIEIKRKNCNEALKMHILDSKPCIFDYDRYIGKIVWKGDNKIIYYSKDSTNIKEIVIDKQLK